MVADKGKNSLGGEYMFKRIITLVAIMSFCNFTAFAAIGDMIAAGDNTAGDDCFTVDSSGNTNVKNNLTVTGATAFDEEIDIDLDARDEEFNITTSSNVPAGYGVVQVVNTSSAVSEQHYLLELWQKNQSDDADGDFITCKASATAVTVFKVEEAGNTTVGGTLAVTGAQTFTGATGVLGAMTMGTAAADCGVFSMIKGTTGSDPTFSITQAATAVTIDETVGDIAITAADDITVTATGANISLVGATAVTGALSATGALTASSTLAVTGNMSFSAGYKQSYVVMADSGTLTVSSATIVIASKATEQEITLPTAVGNGGLTFTIKKSGAAGVVTVTTNASETIDGADGYTAIDAQYDFITIVSDNANWHIVSRYIQ